MIRTVEAVIDEQGSVRLLEPIRLPATRRALVTILEEEPPTRASETALLSEAALAEDWNRPEEDAARSHREPQAARQLRPFGLCKGEFVVPDDFNDPLPEEILSAFEGR